MRSHEDATAAPVEALMGDRSTAELLRMKVASAPQRTFIKETHGETTFAAFAERVAETRELLEGLSVGRGSRVTVSMGNSIAHIALIYALLDMGAVWIPLNPQLRHESVTHIMRDSRATHVVSVDDSGAAALLEEEQIAAVGSIPLSGSTENGRDEARVHRLENRGGTDIGDSRTVAVLYTSGTTGPPKGVQVTDLMLRASAAGCVIVTDARDGDVFYIWEPLFHIGGVQVLLLPLVMDVQVALSPRFSVSRFWREVREFGATHIHHLGGVLQMLLSREPSDDERNHDVRVTWGAGATREVWPVIEERFGLSIRECYGMTENSSVTTVNTSSPEGGIGLPLPWFEVELLDPETGVRGETGEIVVRGRRDGLVTPGYLNNEEANERAFFGDWWRTGDLARRDAHGNLHYLGRVNDSIRVRGENISAWEIESVFDRFPGIARSAAMGIPSELGEQDILLFIVPTGDDELHLDRVADWGAEHLAKFQVPRYVQIVDELPLTPSRRVAKKRLQPDRSAFVPLRAS